MKFIIYKNLLMKRIDHDFALDKKQDENCSCKIKQ